MQSNDLELRLSGTGVPDGELGLDELAGIAKALQDLATRVGRQLVDQSGPGRTQHAIEQVTRLRLRGVSRGSVSLELAYGESNVLPVDIGFERATADRFWEVLDGLGHDVRSPWVAEPVARSVLALLDAFSHAGTNVAASRADGATVEIRPAAARREVWVMGGELVTDTVAVATGRLQAVDLKARRFRLRDDVGNSVELDDVMDADSVGPLVGQRTTASGAAVLGSRGQLKALRGASIELAIPMVPVTDAPTWASIIACAPGPDPTGIVGMTGADVDEFLDLIRS